MKRFTKFMSWFLVLSLILSLVPTSRAEAAKKKVTVKKVTVSSSLSGSTKTVVVAKGKKVKLKTTVTVTPNKAANKKVSYKSENKKIATVNSKGQVKGVKAGKTKITVTSKKDKKKKKTITVKVTKGAVTGVTLNQTSGTIKVGEKVTLRATVKAQKGANKTLAWKSSNESVAKVTKGEVTAVAAGTAVITAQAIDGSGKKATYTVTVQDKPASPNPGPTNPGTQPTNNPIVAAAQTVYGVCAGSVSGSSYPIDVSGGSGTYKYDIISTSGTIEASIDSDGELYYTIPAVGTYSVTVRVTDVNNSNLFCDVVIPFEFIQGIVISGRITDLRGDGIPEVYVDFYNNNQTDSYCSSAYGYTDSDGEYSVVIAPGTYDVDVYFMSFGDSLPSQSLTATKSDVDFQLPLVRVELSSDDPSVQAADFGGWYATVYNEEEDEERDYYCGYGNVVWLKEGICTLTSTKKGGRRTITATVENLEVNQYTTTAIASVVIEETAPKGSVTAETKKELTVTGDYIWYEFTPATSGMYYFWSEGDADVEGTLEDASGIPLAYNDDGAEGLNFYYSHYCEAGETYYVGVRPYDGDGTATTTLQISKEDPGFNNYDDD